MHYLCWLAFSLVLVALLVYLVMMAQFHSFLDPLIMMLAVPPGLAGVLIVLFLTGTPLNSRCATLLHAARVASIWKAIRTAGPTGKAV